MMKSLFVGGMLLLTLFPVKAAEGMWIPLFLEKYNIMDMQAAGCRLTAEQIYSINQDCLADAVVIFDGGCTGEVVSSEGLVLTNHHCGFGAIQSHSTVENDYLTDGFWAMSRDEELPNRGMSVTFLRYIEDVTEEILDGFTEEMNDEQKAQIIRKNMAMVEGTVEEEGGPDAVVKPFYYGNEYYMFVYDVYRDIRLVGAPPSTIGNFGEDTDNWVWPRHTGDFTLFRIYADKDNKPARYDAGNVPYKPQKHFEISMAGVEEGDYTMILGYPGSTQQYLYSGAVRSMMETTLPHSIELRTTRLNIMDSYMKESDRIRIQYAAKYRHVSNSWKKWKGIISGLNRIDAVEIKQNREQAFIEWMEQDDLRKLKYDHLIPEFEQTYNDLEKFSHVLTFLDESVYAVELFREISSLNRLISQGITPDVIASDMESFFKDYHHPIDREIFASMMKAYYNDVDREFHPVFFSIVSEKYKGDFDKFAEDTYKKTLFSSPEKIKKLLERYESNQPKAAKMLSKDPLLGYMRDFREMYLVKVAPEYSILDGKLDGLYKDYMTALREMHADSILFPDANFTMRLAYGKVEGYDPADAVRYDYYTTLSGYIDKSKEGKVDYAIPGKLEELFLAKDYGEYGTDSTMRICFAASNHTTGGNSGSPVLDADGRLIGINFDRNWEGTMSDIMYDPDQCRNIAVDIRYVLFIIDKFADAGYLLEEMEIR